MKIELAATDDMIAACYPVMVELRPQLKREQFVKQIRDQQAQGYRLVYLDVNGSPVAVAGFRVSTNLAWGRFLYVDDLVSLPSQRSCGYGRRLLGWLKQHALDEHCDQIHLDSGMQRERAHHFYKREGMKATGFHFAEALNE